MTELTFKISTDIATIKQYLIDVEKFVSVHPLIYKMTGLGQGKYKIFEKVKIGFFPYNFTYKATITHNDNSVNINASIMGLTKLSMQFIFNQIGDISVVNERVIVKSVLPIKNFMEKLIQKQHQEMFKNIERKENE